MAITLDYASILEFVPEYPIPSTLNLCGSEYGTSTCTRCKLIASRIENT